VLRFDEVKEDNHDGTLTVSMAPILFCKRAHPGEAILEPEEDTWFNVEDAGLVLMAKRITESMNTPALKMQIQALKAQHPTLINEIKRAIDLNPDVFGLLSPQMAFLTQMILNPSPEEMWENLTDGNDYY